MKNKQHKLCGRKGAEANRYDGGVSETRVIITMTAALQRQIREAAKDEGVPLAKWCRLAFSEKLVARDPP